MPKLTIRDYTKEELLSFLKVSPRTFERREAEIKIWLSNFCDYEYSKGNKGQSPQFRVYYITNPQILPLPSKTEVKRIKSFLPLLEKLITLQPLNTLDNLSKIIAVRKKKYGFSWIQIRAFVKEELSRNYTVKEYIWSRKDKNNSYKPLEVNETRFINLYFQQNLSKNNLTEYLKTEEDLIKQGEIGIKEFAERALARNRQQRVELAKAFFRKFGYYPIYVAEFIKRT